MDFRKRQQRPYTPLMIVTRDEARTRRLTATIVYGTSPQGEQSSTAAVTVFSLHREWRFSQTLHRDPTDHKRSVGPLLSLPEVHNRLFIFAHVQRETVVLSPWCKSLYLIQVCGLIIVGNEAQNHSIISKFDNRSGAVRGHAVVWVERVEQGTQDTGGRARPFKRFYPPLIHFPHSDLPHPHSRF